MNIQSESLYNLFYENRKAKFVFSEPGGNHGDYLIYKGGRKLGDLAGLSYQSLTHSDVMNRTNLPCDIAYIHGGGGFNKYWPGEPILQLKRFIDNGNKTILIGPSTFIEDEEFLYSNIVKVINKSVKVYIFAREITSYNILKQIMPKDVEVMIDHDTALNLEIRDIYPKEVDRKYTLYGIREDKESSAIERKKLFCFWIDPPVYCKSFDEWISLHANAKSVITNRAHSSILASILGKETYVLPNSYHKNRSIWEYSLKQRGVKWLNEIEFNLINKLLYKMPGYNRVVNSYKLNKWLQRFFIERQ